eukprot:m.31340 g.31340  ORF g.31340 m.31340 type:complete len:453 (+) comp8307_c0_seq1:192-1550(+)
MWPLTLLYGGNVETTESQQKTPETTSEAYCTPPRIKSSSTGRHARIVTPPSKPPSKRKSTSTLSRKSKKLKYDNTGMDELDFELEMFLEQQHKETGQKQKTKKRGSTKEVARNQQQKKSQKCANRTGKKKIERKRKVNKTPKTTTKKKSNIDKVVQSANERRITRSSAKQQSIREPEEHGTIKDVSRKRETPSSKRDVVVPSVNKDQPQTNQPQAKNNKKQSSTNKKQSINKSKEQSLSESHGENSQQKRKNGQSASKNNQTSNSKEASAIKQHTTNSNPKEPASSKNGETPASNMKPPKSRSKDSSKPDKEHNQKSNNNNHNKKQSSKDKNEQQSSAVSQTKPLAEKERKLLKKSVKRLHKRPPNIPKKGKETKEHNSTSSESFESFLHKQFEVCVRTKNIEGCQMLLVPIFGEVLTELHIAGLIETYNLMPKKLIKGFVDRYEKRTNTCA